MDVLADVGYRMAQRETAKQGRSNPENAAKNVESKIAAVGHLGRAGNRGTKGTDNRHKAREDDRAAPVSCVKIVGPLHMAATEKERLFTFVECGACRTSDPVAELVADDGANCYGEQPMEQQRAQRNSGGGGKNPRGDQQG